MSDKTPVAILYNANKPGARANTDLVAEHVGHHATVERIGSIEAAHALTCDTVRRLIVLGGDGSIISVAQEMAPCHVPIIGVNFGKLGYLADFNVPDLIEHIDGALSDDRLISRRMRMGGTIQRPDGQIEHLAAVNDIVVLAGPPFRIIELAIAIDGEHLTNLRGDGVVLATPTGSTAHNLSVGGPILQSEINALVLAPISPHSLTHRPIVVAEDSEIEVRATQANNGTAVVVDGQVCLPLSAGDRLTVRRHEHDLLLVRNPAFQAWHGLVQKLKWGQ